MRSRRLAFALMAVLAAAIAPPLSKPSLAPVDVAATAPVLLRDPYLTDVSASWAMVNLATDTSSPAPIISWGPAAGNCLSPPSSVTATYVTSFGLNDKQFKAQLSGLQPNTAYCYRIVQGGVDLLGSAPVFTSALASGAGDPFTFAVMGDWGAGTTDEAKVLSQIALASPAFIVTVGDNVYNSGTQTEYGDLNGGNAFGPQYWPRVGRTIPAFPATGNHGFSGSVPYFQNWPQDATIAACAQSGCRYQRDTYCCTGTLGTTIKSYPSSWYAFDWGGTRLYILDGAWGDSTGAYLGDRQAHFNGPVAGCPICGAELTWLTNDLASHPAAHKFAFWHYPLYADSSSQGSDGFLNGPENLEGVLASYGVNIVFNGHAHFYERNYPQITGSPMLSYVTGGGGDPLGGVSGHSSFDAYAKSTYHYLRVTVNGSSVTVTPIDENGAVFDAQTYTFAPPSGSNDFSLSASPGSLSVVQGNNGIASISTAVVSGSPPTVALSASGLPAGATATFNPSSVNAGSNSTLTIGTTSSTPAGNYTVTVTGTSTSATHSTSISLTVNAPVSNDFSISASPSSMSLVQGTSGTSTIGTALVSGSAQTVTLSASGLPAGATATFNPSSVNAGSSSTLTISTTSSTPAGTVTVTGTGTSATHSTSISLSVTAPITDDFSISASPGSLTLVQGNSGTSTIGTAVVSGSAQTVTLSASGLPAGAAASFNPSSIASGANSTLTVSSTSSTPAGSYSVTVTGTGTSATHTTSISLTVNAPVTDDFSISASPGSLTLVQGNSGTSTIGTAVVSGSAQTVTLSASGVPAGATASFSPGAVLAGASSTLTISTSASTPGGVYSVTVTGAGSSAVHGAVVSLTVNTPASGPRLVQAAAAGESVSSTTLSATFPSPTVAGHLLVLASSVYSGATNQISRVTDPAGNAWTRIGAFCTAGHYSDGEIWYAANAGSVTSVTVTMATATVVAMQVQEFSGVAATNPLDVSRGASNTGTAADSGSLNPAQPGELAVGFLAGHGSVQAMTISAAGYTAQPQQTSSNGASTPVSVVIGYRVLNSIDPQDLTGTFAASMYWAAGIAIFKSG